MEAWEELCPEDPPGFLFDEAESGYPRTVVAPTGDQSAWVEFSSEEKAREWAWACLGTRKVYAELIAPGLVRKAAIERFGGRDLGVAHIHGDEIHAFEILRWGKVLERGTHEELLRIPIVKSKDGKEMVSGLYHDLWNTQMGEREKAAPKEAPKEGATTACPQAAIIERLMADNARLKKRLEEAGVAPAEGSAEGSAAPESDDSPVRLRRVPTDADGAVVGG